MNERIDERSKRTKRTKEWAWHGTSRARVGVRPIVVGIDVADGVVDGDAGGWRRWQWPWRWQWLAVLVVPMVDG